LWVVFLPFFNIISGTITIAMRMTIMMANVESKDAVTGKNNKLRRGPKDDSMQVVTVRIPKNLLKDYGAILPRKIN
jgi:hypothetical protein